MAAEVDLSSPEAQKYLGTLLEAYRETLQNVYEVAERIQKLGYSLPWVNAPNQSPQNPAFHQTRTNKMRLEIRPGAVGAGSDQN